VIVERERPTVFVVTATAQELATLIGGARMALSIMETDETGTPSGRNAGRNALDKVLNDFDQALRRLQQP
jgi:hypothetical protein